MGKQSKNSWARKRVKAEESSDATRANASVDGQVGTSPAKERSHEIFELTLRYLLHPVEPANLDRVGKSDLLERVSLQLIHNRTGVNEVDGGEGVQDSGEGFEGLQGGDGRRQFLRVEMG